MKDIILNHISTRRFYFLQGKEEKTLAYISHSVELRTLHRHRNENENSLTVYN